MSLDQTSLVGSLGFERLTPEYAAQMATTEVRKNMVDDVKSPSVTKAISMIPKYSFRTGLMNVAKTPTWRHIPIRLGTDSKGSGIKLEHIKLTPIPIP